LGKRGDVNPPEKWLFLKRVYSSRLEYFALSVFTKACAGSASSFIAIDSRLTKITKVTITDYSESEKISYLFKEWDTIMLTVPFIFRENIGQTAPLMTKVNRINP